MLRVFGENLRRVLALSFSNRFRAVVAGLGVTSLVQSSTATCLIVASFVGKNLVTTSAALAVMLGADVGTSLMAVVFSFDLSWLSPLLIFVGVVVFISRQNSGVGAVGRVLIGLGLITLALQLIVARDAAADRVARGARAPRRAAERRAARHRRRRGAHRAVVLEPGDRAADRDARRLGADPDAGRARPGARREHRQRRPGDARDRERLAAGAPPAARQPDLQGRWAPLLFIGLLPQVHVLLQQLVADRAPAGRACSTSASTSRWRSSSSASPAWSAARSTAGCASPPPGADTLRPRHLDPLALTMPSLAISCAAREALHQADVVETMLRGIVPVIAQQRPAPVGRAAQARRHRRRALLGDQVLPDADLGRGAVEGGEPALDRHRLVHDQHGADRRHHRARAAGHRGQEGQEEPQLLRRRHGRDRPPARAAARQPAPGDERVPRRPRARRQAAARGEGALPRPRARVRRQPHRAGCARTRRRASRPARCTST